MADVKISALPLASTPLAGTEVLPIVQSATTDQVSVANLTAGRSVSAASLTLTTTPLAVGSGGTGFSSITSGYIPYATGTNTLGSSSGFTFVGVNLQQDNTGTARTTHHFGSTGGNLYVGVESSAGGAVFTGSSAYAGILGTDNSTPLQFFTNSALRATLDTSGNLLVATTSPWTTPAVSKVYATGGFAVGSSANFSELAFDRINFKVSIFYVLNDVSTGVSLTSGNTSWAAQSDIRLKNVIGKYDNPLIDVLQIEPIKFTWKNDETNKHHVGLSAQSVEKVIPEAVDKHEDGYLSVRYTEILPLVIASIQELAAKVAELEAKI
jgi:hypothetical protein